MNYELHKTTEGIDTILTLVNALRELESVTIDKMVGKYEIDITIKKID